MIILASQSPYRKKLLEKTKYSFVCMKPEVDEDLLKKAFTGSPEELCSYLAFKKAKSVAVKNNEALVIGSDQSLLLEGRHLGKGKTFEGSFHQLKSCSGKTASLITSVTLIKGDKESQFEVITQLKFKPLSDEDIIWYLNKDKPFDCAGSFKMEESGAVLFEYADGSDPTAIEGLPLMKLTIEIGRMLQIKNGKI